MREYVGRGVGERVGKCVRMWEEGRGVSVWVWVGVGRGVLGCGWR